MTDTPTDIDAIYAADLTDHERQTITRDLTAAGWARNNMLPGCVNFVADELRTMKIGGLIYEAFAAGQLAVGIDDNGGVSFKPRGQETS